MYDPGNLYEYINGMATVYLDYDFRELHVAEYTQGDNESITIDVYRHRTPNHAFGIYSQERFGEAKFLNIGVEGYAAPSVLHFLKGSYYIKIKAFGEEAEREETLISIARAIDAGLEAEAHLPKVLACFPQKNKVDQSEAFIARNFLGHSFLSGAFTAEYSTDEDDFRLFIIEAASIDDCRMMVEKYVEFVKADRDEIEAGKYELNDPYNGPVTLYWKGAVIWGAVDGGEAPVEYLVKVENLLRKNGFLD